MERDRGRVILGELSTNANVSSIKKLQVGTGKGLKETCENDFGLKQSVSSSSCHKSEYVKSLPADVLSANISNANCYNIYEKLVLLKNTKSALTGQDLNPASFHILEKKSPQSDALALPCCSQEEEPDLADSVASMDDRWSVICESDKAGPHIHIISEYNEADSNNVDWDELAEHTGVRAEDSRASDAEDIGHNTRDSSCLCSDKAFRSDNECRMVIQRHLSQLEIAQANLRRILMISGEETTDNFLLPYRMGRKDRMCELKDLSGMDLGRGREPLWASFTHAISLLQTDDADSHFGDIFYITENPLLKKALENSYMLSSQSLNALLGEVERVQRKETSHHVPLTWVQQDFMDCSHDRLVTWRETQLKISGEETTDNFLLPYRMGRKDRMCELKDLSVMDLGRGREPLWASFTHAISLLQIDDADSHFGDIFYFTENPLLKKALENSYMLSSQSLNALLDVVEKVQRKETSHHVPLTWVQQAASRCGNDKGNQFRRHKGESSSSGGSKSDGPSPDGSKLHDPSSRGETGVASFKRKRLDSSDHSEPHFFVNVHGLADCEEFNPYTMSTSVHEGYHDPGVVYGSCEGWLLVAPFPDDLLYFLQPLTGRQLDLPPPDEGLPHEGFIAGTFTSSPLEAGDTVLVRRIRHIGEDAIELWGLFAGSDAWARCIVPDLEDGFKSLVTHGGRLWWINDTGSVHVAEYDDGVRISDEEGLFRDEDGAALESVLVPCNGSLYIVGFHPFPTPPEWRLVNFNADTGVISYSRTDDLSGNNFFLQPGMAGIARLGPEHVRNVIFMAMHSGLDCTQFNIASMQHIQIKDCREGAEHHHCAGYWLDPE